MNVQHECKNCFILSKIKATITSNTMLLHLQVNRSKLLNRIYGKCINNLLQPMDAHTNVYTKICVCIGFNESKQLNVILSHSFNQSIIITLIVHVKHSPSLPLHYYDYKINFKIKLSRIHVENFDWMKKKKVRTKHKEKKNVFDSCQHKRSSLFARFEGDVCYYPFSWKQINVMLLRSAILLCSPLSLSLLPPACVLHETLCICASTWKGMKRRWQAVSHGKLKKRWMTMHGLKTLLHVFDDVSVYIQNVYANEYWHTCKGTGHTHTHQNQQRQQRRRRHHQRQQKLQIDKTIQRNLFDYGKFMLKIW